MQKKISFIIMGIFLIASVIPAHAQTGQVSIGLRDRQGKETSKITDGNTIQLSVKLAATTSAADVAFFLDGVDQAVATCALAAGADSCLSAPFPALGWYWNADGTSHPERAIRVKIGGQDADGVMQVSVQPRPVVMVHGFLSNWETWQQYLGDSGYLASIGIQGFAVGDGQTPGLLNTGHIDDPTARTNTIAQNAEILSQYIAGVQQKTGAEQVDLLVHSMGGMISRYYLDRVMGDDNVAQVIFLGTPMSGSACVFPLASLGFMLPAALEIQPSYMVNIFNKQIIHRRGVAFHMLAGTFLIDPLTSPCAAAPSDTVVALSSATFIPLDDIQRIPLMHGDLTTDAGIFEKGVQRLLQSAPGSFDPRPDPQPSTATDIPEQFSRSYIGHLAPGQTAEVTIHIDPNVTLANFSLYDSSRSLRLEVRGASGNVIELDAQKNGILKIDDPSTMLYLGYGFKEPKPGAWVVKLQTTDQTPARGADYAINARYIGGATLEANTSQTILEMGQPVTLNARLRGAGTSIALDSAVALIRKPDGSSESLALAANGDGYSVVYRPEQAGLYNAEVNVIGKTAEDVTIDRAAYLSFETQPGGQEIMQSRIIWIIAILAVPVFFVIAIFLKRRGRRAG